MESGVCVDCITVEAVSDVLTLQFRQRKTTEEPQILALAQGGKKAPEPPATR
jgi:hypothetical protein